MKMESEEKNKSEKSLKEKIRLCKGFGGECPHLRDRRGFYDFRMWVVCSRFGKSLREITLCDNWIKLAKELGERLESE